MPNPNGNKKNLRSWEPGQSGNPKGRPKGSSVRRNFTACTRHEVLQLFNTVLLTHPADLHKFKGNILEMWVASAIQKSIKKGDHRVLNMFLDCLFGRNWTLPQEEDPEYQYAMLSEEELLEQMKAAVIDLEQRINAKDAV